MEAYHKYGHLVSYNRGAVDGHMFLSLVWFVCHQRRLFNTVCLIDVAVHDHYLPVHLLLILSTTSIGNSQTIKEKRGFRFGLVRFGFFF